MRPATYNERLTMYTANFPHWVRFTNHCPINTPEARKMAAQSYIALCEYKAQKSPKFRARLQKAKKWAQSEIKRIQKFERDLQNAPAGVAWGFKPEDGRSEEKRLMFYTRLQNAREHQVQGVIPHAPDRERVTVNYAEVARKFLQRKK